MTLHFFSLLKKKVSVSGSRANYFKKSVVSVATGAKCQESSRKQLHIHCETGGLGFIAQHVESIEGLECLVSEDFDCRDENLRVKHMNYNGVTTISVQALKELITRVEDLETRLAVLETS